MSLLKESEIDRFYQEKLYGVDGSRAHTLNHFAQS